uniref:Choline dehydrogenase n=1 Tax=Irpex lacteus TaxID=5319 RepID=A0A0P0I834_IRPLA|nr:choline dehydrogenase [Irpex lacteus]
MGRISGAALLVCFASLAAAQTPRHCATPSITPTKFADTKFDYLIVGGGTAGLVLASRLADNPLLQIGVIEAGVYHPIEPLIDTPANVGVAAGDPKFDWNFLSVPQTGIAGRQMAVPRGKMLGGSSGLNFLAWNRAASPEYDAWNHFASGQDWTFNGLLPFFEKATTTKLGQVNPFPGISRTERTADFNPGLVGTSGLIQSSFNEVYSDPIFPSVKAFNALGIRTNPNPDNGTTAGVVNSRRAVDVSRGVRSYATQYYCRSVSRSNFRVLTGAQATKVVLKSSKGIHTAIGVQYIANGTSFTSHASKEVILSAGAIQSPQLLELSGIGNSTLLRSLNITPLVDLPGVGENLQDHLFAGVEYQVKPGVITLDSLHNNDTFSSQQHALYNKNGSGFLAAFDSGMSFLPFGFYLNSSDVQSLLQTFDAVPVQQGTLQPLQHQIQRQWIQSRVVPHVQTILHNAGQLPPLSANLTYFTAFGGTLHPWARGTVHINTTDPLTAPVINQNYLDNDFDVRTLLTAVRFLIKLGTTPPLADLIETQVTPPPQLTTDEELIAYIRAASGTSSHPSGTAALGPRASGGVVDANLIVYGTSNLRVVDASVIPMIVGANLQETVYAISEKAYEIIKCGL